MSIKNIIFDFWGVLFFEDTDKFSQQIANKLPDGPEKLDKIKEIMKELIKIARNGKPVNSWLEKYEKLTGLKGFTADVWGDNFFTNKSLEIWMKENQHNYNLYYLTNINPFRFAKCQEADLFKFFQGGVASCDVKARKPKPEIYQILLQKYNLKPEESLFIDDKLENIQTAQRLGFETILFDESKDNLADKIAEIEDLATIKKLL